MYFIIFTVLSLFVYFTKYLKFNGSSVKSAKKESFEKIVYQYRPIELKQIVALINRLKDRLIRIGVERDNALISSLNDLLSRTETIYPICIKFCCSRVESNGYFSFMKFIFKTIEAFENEFQKIKNDKSSEQSLKNLTICIDLLIEGFKVAQKLADKMNLEDEERMRELEQELLKYPEELRDLKLFRKIESVRNYSEDDLMNNNLVRDEDTNNNLLIDGKRFNSLPLFCPHQSTVCDVIYKGVHLSSPKHNNIFFGKYLAIWLDRDIAKFYKLGMFFFPFSKARLYEYPKLIYDQHFRAQVVGRCLRQVTVNYPFSLWDLVDSWPVKLFVNFKTRHLNTECSEFYIPAQDSIEINKSTVDRLKINDTDRINFNEDRKLKCLLTKPKDLDLKNCDKLILFFAGSGFFSSTVYASQIYLKFWTNYSKIPILSVHYRIKEAFPAAHQDCLSVYIWLRKAPVEEVKSKLGFYPKKIVCIGDSAGANLALGVTLALNDLRTDYKSKFKIEIPMPDGILPICGPFIFTPFPCASKICSFVDVVLPVTVQVEIIRGMIGNIPNLRPNTFYETIMAHLFPFREKPWLDCPREQFDEKMMLLAKNVASPYFSPVYYKNYDQLFDIKMHLISVEFCPFVDDSIIVAKLLEVSKNVKVSMLPDLIHGFLGLVHEKESAYKAAVYCCQQAIELFGEEDQRIVSNEKAINVLTMNICLQQN